MFTHNRAGMYICIQADLVNVSFFSSVEGVIRIPTKVWQIMFALASSHLGHQAVNILCHLLAIGDADKEAQPTEIRK
jgi:hypothetical protein